MTEAQPLPPGSPPRDPCGLLMEAEVREELERRCQLAGSQLAWATENGVTAAYVSDVLQGRRQPGASILRGLGYEKVIGYRPPTQPTPDLSK